MKRVWFAVVFILLSAGLCIYEQYYVKTSCENMIQILEQAQEFEEAKDSENRNKKIDELQSYWKSRNDFLFAFSEHSTLDELAQYIRSLKAAHSMKSSLEETKALVLVFYEDARISFSNIL
ncbi:MAG: DUF4363 family protein [Eubacterium sp.]|nr:DUF4363 family protein [Eubacterium sp.]